MIIKSKTLRRTYHLRESLNCHFSLLLAPERRVSLLDSYLDGTVLTNQSTPCLKVPGPNQILLQGNSLGGVMVRFVYALLVFVCMISSNTQDICLDGGGLQQAQVHHQQYTPREKKNVKKDLACRITPALTLEACAVARAETAISCLTNLDVAELRSYISPPPAVSLVTKAMFILLSGGKTLSWKQTRHAMAGGDIFLLDNCVHIFLVICSKT